MEITIIKSGVNTYTLYQEVWKKIVNLILVM